jgi:hypothetical protein
MKARLSNLAMEIPALDESPEANRIYPLQDFTTRDASEPVIALLDAWAMVADVLTFYQERVANEGYLRTATERRSVLELGRLVGYALRPGVSSSVYLAYTLDDQSVPVEIPAGARAQSLPGPGELPQSFETGEPLQARKEWNVLKPRMTQPQTKNGITKTKRLWLKGFSTNLKANDLLLVDFGDGPKTTFRVQEVKPDIANDRTLVILQGEATESETEPSPGTVSLLAPAVAPEAPAAFVKGGESVKALDLVLTQQLITASVQSSGPGRVKAGLSQQFAAKSDNRFQLVKAFHPELSETLAPALANADSPLPANLRVYAFRVVASVFGNIASPLRRVEQDGTVTLIGEPRMFRILPARPPIESAKTVYFGWRLRSGNPRLVGRHRLQRRRKGILHKPHPAAHRKE